MSRSASIKDCVETRIVRRIECMICDCYEEAEDIPLREFARKMEVDGWRYEVSVKFASHGPMCPVCVATPDLDRGES